MDKLKPCPFCGSSKTKIEHKGKRIGHTGLDLPVYNETYSVRCNVCHARGGTESGKVVMTFREELKPEWAENKVDIEKKAIEAWNRREGD